MSNPFFLQVVIPLGVQKQVGSLLRQHLDQKRMNANLSLNAGIPGARVNDSLTFKDDSLLEQNEHKIPDSTVLENILRRRSLHIRNMQRSWQVFILVLPWTYHNICDKLDYNVFDRRFITIIHELSFSSLESYAFSVLKEFLETSYSHPIIGFLFIFVLCKIDWQYHPRAWFVLIKAQCYSELSLKCFNVSQNFGQFSFGYFYRYFTSIFILKCFKSPLGLCGMLLKSTLVDTLYFFVSANF